MYKIFQQILMYLVVILFYDTHVTLSTKEQQNHMINFIKNVQIQMY